MLNIESIKGKIKYISKTKNIQADFIWQKYFIDRIMKLVSDSKYNDKVIVKGGYLLSSIFGMNRRITKDLDITLKNISIEKSNVIKMFNDILSSDKDIKYSIERAEKIIEGGDYDGIRLLVRVDINNKYFYLKLDISTGDVITPKEKKVKLKSEISDEEIVIYSYNFETIMAEKLESIIIRNIDNTRMKDYYDIYVITQLKNDEINKEILKKALKNTCDKRNSYKEIKDYKNILNSVRKDNKIKELWLVYQQQFKYAENIKIEKICDVIEKILDKVVDIGEMTVYWFNGIKMERKTQEEFIDLAFNGDKIKGFAYWNKMKEDLNNGKEYKDTTYKKIIIESNENKQFIYGIKLNEKIANILLKNKGE